MANSKEIQQAITSCHVNTQKVDIRAILTHGDFDRGKWTDLMTTLRIIQTKLIKEYETFFSFQNETTGIVLEVEGLRC